VVFLILFLSVTSSRVCASDVVVSVVVDKQSLAVVKGQTLSFDAPNKIKKTTTIKSNTYSYSSVTDSSSSYDVVFNGLLQSGYPTATTAQGSRSYGSYNVYVYINGHKYTYQYGTTYRVNGVVSSIYFESTCTAEYQGGYDYVLKKYGKYIGNEYLKSTDLTVTINKVRSAEEQQLIDEVKNGNKLQEKGNELQQEGNNLQKEQNDISKGIFDKIADFFGSFFSNLMDSIKGLFIPEDGYFSDFFTRLNDFFFDKLGHSVLRIVIEHEQDERPHRQPDTQSRITKSNKHKNRSSRLSRSRNTMSHPFRRSEYQATLVSVALQCLRIMQGYSIPINGILRKMNIINDQILSKFAITITIGMRAFTVFISINEHKKL
jgi:hypothetical protein